MRFGILGRLEVDDDGGRPVELGGPQPRLLLAMLLVAGGQVVATDAMVEALWGDGAPSSPVATLQTYVSRLRRVLGTGRITWEAPGYRLVTGAEEIDAWRFERLAREGRALLDGGDPATARDLLLEADGLWRGPALQEVRDRPFASGAAHRLEDLRLAAIEDRLEAELRLGRHEAAAVELADLVAAHPLREGLRGRLALARYRGGRQAEALQTIDEGRRLLREGLGLELSPPLQALEAAILGHEPSLVAPGRGPAPAPAAGGGRGPLVGRQAELDVLLAALDDAAAGLRMVVVEGEPGIGKTRLVEELAVEAARRGVVVAWGRCYEGAAAPAFWPWLAALRSLVSSVPAAGSPALDGFLAPATDAAADQLPAHRFAVYEAVASALARAAADRTVVLVVEDLQWADDASLELLAHLATGGGGAAGADGARVLVLVTVRQLEIGRADAVVDGLAAVARRPTSRRFRLPGLLDSAIAELLAGATGRPAGTEVAAVINQRAEGNPFYAVELARLLLDDGYLSPAQIAAAEVPAGVRDVVRQRIARLPGATVELLQVAAVVGRDVEVGILTRAAGLDRADVLDALEPALVHRLVVDADLPGTYRFAHALVREALADDLSSLRRARLHLQVADALEATGRAGDDDAEIIAEHLYAAAHLGIAARAAEAQERAAGVAIRRSAHVTAEGLLERAVALWRAAGASPEHRQAELDALASRFFVQRVVRGHQAAVDGPTMQEARALARRLGRTDVLARLLWAEWVGVDKACELDRSAALTEELRSLAAASDDPMALGLSLHATGVLRWHGGDLPGATEALDRAVRLNQETLVAGQGRIEALTAPLRPSAWPLGHPVVPFVHLLVGDLDDPVGSFERLLANDRDPFAATVAWMFAGFGALAVGDLEAAVAFGRRGHDADPDLRFSYWGPGSQLCLGAALAASGDLAAGRGLVDEALPVYLASGTRIFVPLVHARVAQGLGRAGHLDDAVGLLATAVAQVAAFGERWLDPIVGAVGAELDRLGGAAPSAVAPAFATARASATAQGAHAVARHIAWMAEAHGT